jgi:hypothetical protein
MNHNIKNRPTRKTIFYWLLALFLLFNFTDQAFSENIDQVVLIHVKSVKTNKEFRLQSITTTSLEALNRKNKIIIFFDLEAVKAIKIGRWYGGDTTILDKVKIKDYQRKKLSNDLNISLASLPLNYGELFRLMRGKGVELYVNETVMKELKIEDEEYDFAFTPINNDKIVDIFLNSDIYISY